MSLAKSRDSLAYAIRLSNLNQQDGNGLLNDRFTTGGVRCIQEFLTVDNKTKIVRDCTISQEPNGMSSGKEWCYTNMNTAEWDFCVPTLDYNKGRMQVSKNLQKKIAEIR